MPGDIEAHRGIDNNVYVIDFARVFPPGPFSTSFSIVGSLPPLPSVPHRANTASPLECWHARDFWFCLTAHKTEY